MFWFLQFVNKHSSKMTFAWIKLRPEIGSQPLSQSATRAYFFNGDFLPYFSRFIRTTTCLYHHLVSLCHTEVTKSWWPSSVNLREIFVKNKQKIHIPKEKERKPTNYFWFRCVPILNSFKHGCIGCSDCYYNGNGQHNDQNWALHVLCPLDFNLQWPR